tara:strand:- start:979 stop:1293 length:315 start_codon:yes stop_codon:yes gene_type:complete
MIKEIQVKELKDSLDKKELKLIDVREIEEYAICNIEPSVHIPMNKIPSHLEKLDKDTRYAIICHSGVRSHNVCFYLQNHGFKVRNVVGGIHQWALEIDDTMKIY